MKVDKTQRQNDKEDGYVLTYVQSSKLSGPGLNVAISTSPEGRIIETDEDNIRKFGDKLCVDLSYGTNRCLLPVQKFETKSDSSHVFAHVSPGAKVLVRTPYMTFSEGDTRGTGHMRTKESLVDIQQWQKTRDKHVSDAHHSIQFVVDKSVVDLDSSKSPFVQFSLPDRKGESWTTIVPKSNIQAGPTDDTYTINVHPSNRFASLTRITEGKDAGQFMHGIRSVTDIKSELDYIGELGLKKIEIIKDMNLCRKTGTYKDYIDEHYTHGHLAGFADSVKAVKEMTPALMAYKSAVEDITGMTPQDVRLAHERGESVLPDDITDGQRKNLEKAYMGFVEALAKFNDNRMAEKASDKARKGLIDECAKSMTIFRDKYLAQSDGKKKGDMDFQLLTTENMVGSVKSVEMGEDTVNLIAGV